MKIPFTKMHGCGNDFVLVDSLDGRFADLPLPVLAAKICDRHFGVGSDGLIAVLPSTDADYRMRMLNPDGSESQMCGNGIRCFARYIFDRGLGQASARIETLAGIKEVQLAVDNGAVGAVRVNMGVPVFESPRIPTLVDLPMVRDFPLDVAGRRFLVSCVSMGNPHSVAFLDQAGVDALDTTVVGPLIEHHRLFPERTNAEFCAVLDRHAVRMRVWERGAGVTLACGTGACASAVAAIDHGLVEPPVRMVLDGGELNVEWAGPGQPVFMSGPAEYVFDGVYSYRG